MEGETTHVVGCNTTRDAGRAESVAVMDENVVVKDENVSVKDEIVAESAESKNESDTQLPVYKEKDKILRDFCGEGYAKTGIARHRKNV